MQSLDENIISKELYDFFEKSYDPIMITTTNLEDDHPKILFCNKAFEILSGYTFNELYNKTPRILQGEKTKKKTLVRIKESLKQSNSFEGELINYKKDGTCYLIKLKIYAIKDKNEKAVYYVCIQKDITNEMFFKVNKEIFDLSMDNSMEHVAIIDLNENYTYVNKSYCKRCGYSEEELIGNNPNILKSGKHDKSFYKKLRENLLNKEPFEAIFINKHKDGTLYYDKQTITPILINDEIQSYLVVGKDISKELRNRVHLKNLALKDQLTSLYNRNGFEEIIPKIVLNHASNNFDYVFVMIDIDFFKNINDKYGHGIGDEILKEFASLITQNIRTTDYAFRWGGEEFLVVLNTNMKNAYDIVESLRKSVESYKFLSDIRLTASFGISKLIIGNHKETIEDCDIALYDAKNSGRNRIIICGE